MPVTYEIPISAAVKLVNAASAYGVRPEELCRAAGLDVSALEDGDNQMPFTQLIGLGECGARLTGDEAFGLHVGERADPKTYGLLGYVTINSANFGEALGRMIRYQRIRTKAVEFSLEIVGADAQLIYRYRTTEVAPQGRRQESEEMLSTMMRVGRELTKVDWTPREVHFEHQRPEDVSEHDRIFRAPVLFTKPLTKLIFDASILTLPLAEADVTLGTLLERQAEVLSANSPRPGAFANQVQQLIKENLSVGEGRMGVVCRRLGLSTRTLQRKLLEEETSYAQLLEEAQRVLAEFYLRQSEIAISEISYLLGFSQPSAFHRAFRRWVGVTPREFRHRQKR